MKKRFAILILLVLAGLFCCGCVFSKKANYLDEESRKQLETQLLSDMTLILGDSGSQQGFLELANHTGYDLTDLSIRWSETNDYIAFITRFPAGAKARLAVNANESLQEKAKENNDMIKMKYTVGAYSYLTQPLAVEMNNEQNPMNVEIIVETEDGDVRLEIDGTTPFPKGNEINGLYSARITALKTSLNPVAGNRFQLNMSCEGREPSGSGVYLVYKLINSDGIILESSTAYFTDGTAPLYFTDIDVLNTGRYILRFEEHS